MDSGRWSRMLYHLSVCSFAPHSQAAVVAIFYSLIVKWNSPRPVRRQSGLTYTGLEKNIPDDRPTKLTCAMNGWSQDVYSPPLHVSFVIGPLCCSGT